MRTGRTVAVLLSIAMLLVSFGERGAEAQAFQAEVGGGWAIPSSDVEMQGTSENGRKGTTPVDPGSGAHVYGAVGLVWTLSDNFDLGVRLRGQHSKMTGRFSNFDFSNELSGRLRSLTLEGQLVLTSVGRINPYFLVGLGVIRTTVDGVLVTVSQNGQEDREIQFSEVNVTDAGGDVGFGARTRLVGGLQLTAEMRATGSLPGAKDNAVMAFPFTLGLGYTFGTE